MKTSRFTIFLLVFSLTAAALFTFGVVSPSANAATATWDAGGGANDNWDYQSVPGTYDNWAGNLLPAAADDVIFQNVASAGNSISLNGDRTVNSLTLNQTTNQNFSIDNNILTVTSGSITRNAGSLASSDIGTTILLGTNGVIVNNSANGRLLVRVVDDGESTFDVSYRGIGGTLVSTVMDNASTYGGASFLAGTNLTLNAATRIASILNSSSITVASGGLILGAGAAAAAPDNGTTTFGRIGNSAPVTLHGGRLTMLGSNNQTGDNATERFGTLGFATGLSTLRVTRGTGTADATLFANAFSRDGTANGTRGTVFIDQNLTTQQLGLSEFIKGVSYTGLTTVGGGSSRATNDSIVPYMVVDNVFGTSGRADSFVRVDSNNGLVPLVLADYATDINTVNGDGNDNVRLSGSAATFTMNANTTINALVLDNLSSGSATELTGSAGTILTVKSGAILGASTGNANAGSRLSVPTLAFGSVEGVLTNSSGGGTGFQVTSNITGSNGLTLNAGANLQLTGSNSGLSGPLTVNSGRLSPGVNGLNTNTPLRAFAGATVVAPSASGGVTLTVPSVSGAGTLEVSNNSGAMYISGTAATGLSGFTLLAGGSISPGDAPQFPGTTLSTGTLTLRNANSNSPGGNLVVRLNGGILNIDLASRDYYDSLALTSAQATPAVTLTMDGSTTLALTLGFAPVLGDLFKIVDVAGTTASTGSFSNLSAVTTTYQSNLYDFSILYNSSLGGGTGNDIVLRLDNIVITPTTTTGSYSLAASASSSTIIVGGTSSISSVITNTGTGTADTLNYGPLTVTYTGGTTTLSGSGTGLAQGASGTAAGGFTNNVAGTYTLTPAGTVTNATLSGTSTPTLGTVTSATVTVLNHSNAALSIASGGTQTIITGGTFNAVTFNLTNAGTNNAAVQVSGLVNLTGSTGSAVVASGGTASYAGINLSNTSVGTNDLVVSATAGDQQSLSGANALTTLSATTSYTVLDHATSSLLGSGVLTSTTLDLGTWDYSAATWTSGSGAANFSIFNLAGSGGDALTALLALTSSTSSGDAGFSTNLNTYSQIAGGTSQAFSVSFVPTGSTSGLFTRTFTINMADQQNLSGAASTNTLTVTANVIVVPEPGTMALASLGLGVVGFAAWRCRRRSAA